MKCYLAHPVTDYGGSARQMAAIAVIEAVGWTVETPDQPIHQDAYRQHGMQHFLDVVEDCDALAFLRFADGYIGAGMAKEIEHALRRGLDVFDVSRGYLEPIDMMPDCLLNVEQTRAKIAHLRTLSFSATEGKS
jgi:uncharacterized NAD-dependent epimerase/dehydratase family protein